MSETHAAYLSLGSNIQPEVHLIEAISRLQKHGGVQEVSGIWESRSVGAEGPNYLNVCLLFGTPLAQADLKEQLLLPIEKELGRQRGPDKFAPRTIDIDIVVFDGVSCNDKYWSQAFVVIPLAEIYPDYRNPVTGEPIGQTARRLRQELWMEARPELLGRINASRSRS